MHDKEIQKTSSELIRELQSPKRMQDNPIPIGRDLEEIIERRVREKYFQANKEFELGRHVHAIMQFLKGYRYGILL